MKWSVADNACEQSYSTRLAQDECTSQSSPNGGSFAFETSKDSTGAIQYLCYEYASSDVDTQSTTQAACTTAHKNDDTWVFAGGKCFQFAKQLTGTEYCEGKGAGWSVLENGVCTQAAILTADQCNAKTNTNTNTKWDVVNRQCIQYITLDTTPADAISCTSTHAKDLNAIWIWITTEQNPTAGVCAETMLLNTTAAQCEALGSKWQYDTSKNKCVQNVDLDTSAWTTLKTQCTSMPGYYWIATSADSTKDSSGICKSANMLTSAECGNPPNASFYYGIPIVVSWDTDLNNSAGLCVTQNTGEALCRLAGFSWNYGTMSCQYCAGATEDLIGWSSAGERVCKAPPYVSVELGYYHSCAKLRKKGGLPSVECWGGIDGTGAVPVNETFTDTNEGRTMPYGGNQ